jgi:ATP-dependent DNA helicase DinG
VMNKIADMLSDFFEANQIKLMVQGRTLQRNKMLDIFRTDINSVIFGTDSFWMGVDVPGEALSNVIIVKLPFAVPSHPLISARKEKVERAGGNSFRDYFLPEAVLKFRQGVGRLIRSKDDRGIIVVLDPRIIRTDYGKIFLQSVPDCHCHFF